MDSRHRIPENPGEKPPQKCYSYIRMSSTEQRFGDSLRRQTEVSQRWAATHGYTIDDSIQLKDMGVSAWTGDNAETGRLKAFLDAVDSGRVASGSILLVENLDRLSRQKVRKALELFLAILNRGITIQTLSPEQTFTPDKTDAIEIMMAILSLSRAHEESEVKSVRSRGNWTKRLNEALEGNEILTGRCPLWMKPSKNRKGFELIPDRAAIVEDIYKKSCEGLGVLRLIGYLQKTYPKALGGHGGKWSKSSVKRILTDRAAIGELQPHKKRDGKRIPFGDPIKNYYPSVVTDELFYKAQDARAKNYIQRGRKSKKCSNLFTGLVFNEKNVSMCVIEKDVEYLISYDATRGAADYITFPYKVFEAGILMAVAQLRNHGIEDSANQKAIEELNILASKEKEIDSKIKNIQEKILNSANIDPFMVILETLSVQAKEIKDQIPLVKSRIKTTSNYDDVFSLCDLLHGSDVPSDPEELLNLREKTKILIRDVIKRVNVEVFLFKRTRRFCFIVIEVVNDMKIYLICGSGRLMQPLFVVLKDLNSFNQAISSIKASGKLEM